MIANADAARIPLPDKSVHCTVCSPPYFGPRKYKGEQARDWPAVSYSPMPGMPPLEVPAMRCELGREKTPEAYTAHLVLCFREVHRVLRDDGTAWCVIGDSFTNDTKWGGASGGKNYTSAAGGYEGQRAKRQTGVAPGNLLAIPYRLLLALQADGWLVRNDVVWSKCLGHSTRVYAKTQKGEMPMTVGEMVRLRPETVKLWTGKDWAQVKRFHQSEQTEGIEICFRNGQRISSTPEHIWPTEKGHKTAAFLQIGDKLLSAKLPEPERPETPQGIPDKFGWVIGFYIAEGIKSKKRGVGFCMHVDEAAETEKLREFADFYGSGFSTTVHGLGKTIKVEGGAARAIIETYVWGDDCRHKHLTTAAWQRSDEFLRNVLQGYLDGDGHKDPQNNRWRLGFTRNDALADDIRTICARIGVSVRMTRAWHTCGDKKFWGFRGDLTFDPTWRKCNDWEIIGLQKSKGTKFFDIEIDEPHIFTLACGVLTHNCAPMPESVSGTHWERHQVKVAKSARANPNSSHAKSQQGANNAQGARDGVNFADHSDEYTDCPGCPKCSATGGYVLRRGSWRHTRSHETVLMLTKGMQYYSDQERVREKYNPNSLERYEYEFNPDTPSNQATANPSTKGGKIDPNPAGRNPRDVLTPSPSPFKGPHYAAFPPDLIRPLILSSAPLKCCPVCGAGWAAVVEQREIQFRPNSSSIRGQESYQQAYDYPQRAAMGLSTNVIGYRSTCTCLPANGHSEYTSGLVLDPFCGSGTTGLVCRELGLRFVGLDISGFYLRDIALVRSERLTPDSVMVNLPLFELLHP